MKEELFITEDSKYAVARLEDGKRWVLINKDGGILFGPSTHYKCMEQLKKIAS